VNVAKIVQMQDDHELSAAVRSCDIINIDGAGVVLGGRFLGLHAFERVAGIDLFHRLLCIVRRQDVLFTCLARPRGHRKGDRQFAIGLSAAEDRRFLHGYFWDEEETVVRQIRESGAELLFVGIRSPMKERFISRWRDEFRGFSRWVSEGPSTS
jgi:N-acetylglucosaminyldiphosphoundecaprenol N-acetyl-beta-D-mannosaminyltransferase